MPHSPWLIYIYIHIYIYIYLFVYVPFDAPIFFWGCFGWNFSGEEKRLEHGFVVFDGLLAGSQANDFVTGDAGYTP